jgi:hypothetical protein
MNLMIFLLLANRYSFTYESFERRQNRQTLPVVFAAESRVFISSRNDAVELRFDRQNELAMDRSLSRSAAWGQALRQAQGLLGAKGREPCRTGRSTSIAWERIRSACYAPRLKTAAKANGVGEQTVDNEPRLSV